MTQLVLVLLAVAWIAVLAPDAVRLLRPRRRALSSVDMFRQQLDSLGRSAPAAARRARPQDAREGSRRLRRWKGFRPSAAATSLPTASMPASPQQAAVRRRDIATLLVLCLAVTLAGTLVTGSAWALAAFVATFGLTAGYVALLMRRRRSVPTAEVHYLPLANAPASATVTMIRRTANE